MLMNNYIRELLKLKDVIVTYVLTIKKEVFYWNVNTLE